MQAKLYTARDAVTTRGSLTSSVDGTSEVALCAQN